ncbi:MAG: phage antirepressor KilAC domain-containing protein [Peptococcaceae bacterium]|nr:phage antirepressor KilAC domain-containing protein [Peptococcaceae bacterium]
MRMNNMNQNTMNQNNANEPQMMTDTFSPEAMEMVRSLLDAIDEHRYYRRKAEKQLEAQKGKVQFADAVAASEDSILVREMAVHFTQAGFSLNERQLYDWLRGNGYVYRQPGGRNIPTKKSLSLGVMELHKNVITNRYGKTEMSRTARITARGQQYFFDMLMQEKRNAEKAAAEAAEKARKAVMDKAWWEQRQCANCPQVKTCKSAQGGYDV